MLFFGGIALSQLVPQVRQGNWMEAIEMLGEANPFRDSGMSFPRYQESFLNELSPSGRSGAAVPNIDGGIKVSTPLLLTVGLVLNDLD
jgi:anaphase-promoting complex subunit 6